MSAEATEVGASIHEKLMEKLEPIQGETTPEIETEEVTETTESDDHVEVEAEVSEDSTETQEDNEQPESETLELPELANYLGFDTEKLDVTESGDLVFKTKIDGEDGQATLKDLVKSYQLEGHLNKKNMEVTELKKQLNTQLESNNTQLKERLQQTEDLATVVYNELLKEYGTIDWTGLRQDDPAEWSAKQTDYANRKNQIAQLYQQLQDQKQTTTASDTAATEKSRKVEQDKLVTALNWTTTEQSTKDMTEIANYAGNAGYSQDEFNNMFDHRWYVMASKAAKYDALQSENPRITKKVKKAPKIVKPGAPKVKSVSDEEARLRANIKKNDGKNGSIAALLLHKRKG